MGFDVKVNVKWLSQRILCLWCDVFPSETEYSMREKNILLAYFWELIWSWKVAECVIGQSWKSNFMKHNVHVLVMRLPDMDVNQAEGQVYPQKLILLPLTLIFAILLLPICVYIIAHTYMCI